MNELELRLKGLEADNIPYNMEQFEEIDKTTIILSIYYGYYNQFLEYYDMDGKMFSRQHCNYNDFT